MGLITIDVLHLCPPPVSPSSGGKIRVGDDGLGIWMELGWINRSAYFLIIRCAGYAPCATLSRDVRRYVGRARYRWSRFCSRGKISCNPRLRSITGFHPNPNIFIFLFSNFHCNLVVLDFNYSVVVIFLNAYSLQMIHVKKFLL